MRKLMAVILSVFVALFVFTGCVSEQKVVGVAATPTPTTTPVVATASASAPPVVLDLAKRATAEQGFDPAQIKADQVDKQVAESVPAGSGVFSEKKLITSDDTALFMASGSPQAAAAIASATAQTGATPEELKNPANWVAITTGQKVMWGGNTYFDGAAMVGASTNTIDPSGSVVMVFIPPQQVASGKVTSVFFIRGACGNPQMTPPTPAPADSPTGETPKPTPTPIPTTPPTPDCPNGVCPKENRFAAAQAPPGAAQPEPIGTVGPPTRPAPPDGPAPNAYPTHEVNPPQFPAKPDSGPGATNTLPPEQVPTAPAPPAPAPPGGPAGGIVGSD